MRLDKYLKVSRIIKRRAIAKEIADKGRVQINGIQAKSSSPVSVGDELTLSFGNKTLVVKVEKLVDTTKKEEAKDLYSIIGETYEESSFN